MSKFDRSIASAKRDSLQVDPDAYGRPIYADLAERGQKIVQRVVDKLDATPPNLGKVETDERFAMKQALKKIDIEGDVRRLVDAFSAAIISLRDRYYRDTMFRLAGAFNEATPPFIELAVSFTKKEIDSLTVFVFGRDLRTHLTYIRDRSIFRLQSIIVDSYKQIPRKKQAYRRTYTDALRGALNGLISSLRGLTRGLFSAVYEQAQGRFLYAINHGSVRVA